MSRKGRIGALIGLVVVLLAVGVLVWPTPKEAMASWSAELTLEWFGVGRNVLPQAQFYDSDQQILGQPILLGPTQGWQEWQCDIPTDLGDTPCFVSFNWDYAPAGADLGHHWEIGGVDDNPPTNLASINSQGVHVTAQYTDN